MARLDDFADFDPPLLNDTADRVAGAWSTLYRNALSDLPDRAIVVSHSEVAADRNLAAALAYRLGLPWRSDRSRSVQTDLDRLHNLDRNPADVAEAWRAEIDTLTVARIEQSAPAFSPS